MRSRKAAAEESAFRQCQQDVLASACSSIDPLAANYGDIPLHELQSKEEADLCQWTPVGDLTEGMKESEVLIRGRAQTVRAVGKKMVFVVVRERLKTVQCLVTVQAGLVSQKMVQFAAGLHRESIVEVRGLVSVPSAPVKGTSQKVEVLVQKLYCISRAIPNLPINVDDAARSEKEIEEGLQAGLQYVRLSQDTRLTHRVIDLRTPSSQGICSIQSRLQIISRIFLIEEGFREIHTPKFIAGSSEGGSAVFSLDYFGRPACLAQSPQLHKQMAICSDMGRVFEVGPVFRAEDSNTHRHLCEFVGLDVELEIKLNYSEIMNFVDRLLVTIFDYLNESCKNELEDVRRQYPSQPLKYLRKTLRLKYEEGIQMLKEAGFEVDPHGDLNTELERILGQLVLEKYGTEVYILHRYPLAVRPFYTMPCYDDANYSNSFDVFIRGEEISSGAQRIHEPELLEERAKKCGIDVNTATIAAYIDAFRYGAPPHGGFGVGLERFVMLFCGLNNIRKISLFPRDPRRLAP